MLVINMTITVITLLFRDHSTHSIWLSLYDIWVELILKTFGWTGVVWDWMDQDQHIEVAKEASERAPLMVRCTSALSWAACDGCLLLLVYSLSVLNLFFTMSRYSEIRLLLPLLHHAPSCSIMLQLLALLPDYFHPRAPFLLFSAPVRSASGASWMRADPTNHWELGILITTSRTNWGIPRLSVFPWSLPNQKGGAKALCPTLTTAQNHATTYKSCKKFFQTSNWDCGCAFRIAISCNLDMSWWKSTARSVSLLKKNWFENRRSDNLAKVTTCWCHLLMNQLCQVEAFGIPTSKSVKLLNENLLVDQLQKTKMKTYYMCKMKTRQNKRRQTNQKKLKTTGDNASNRDFRTLKRETCSSARRTAKTKYNTSIIIFVLQGKCTATLASIAFH